jgi:hypothetical protein
MSLLTTPSQSPDIDSLVITKLLPLGAPDPILGNGRGQVRSEYRGEAEEIEQ